MDMSSRRATSKKKLNKKNKKKDNEQLFYEGALDMKWYITNEAHSAQLVMIISYPAIPSRVIVLLKTPRHVIDNLKKKSERKERSFRENRK